MEDNSAHVRRLWRHRGTSLPTPRRGPRQQLDLDEILRTGIAIADTDGLDAVSTRAIAARLGRTAMALYPYVGTKDHLVALMQDQASAMPEWADPATGLRDALQGWAERLFGVYLAHPWLTELPWSRATQGPHEQDWLERLLTILDAWHVDPGQRATTVTMLYATVRATAGTAAGYRRVDPAAWLDQARETARQIPDMRERYPLSTALTPHAADWRDAPRAALRGSVELLAQALVRE
ncbi:TetR family transcriptional regulator [Paractinoplanes deccanensis]|uniref:TetR family transcriptional regulator n=1 Tax=Paractinoplanes deccanensis TaxID=113561 RepID=A0ABQ3YKI7_9ACTN|nr:TetR family transcriptional regulator [Actinoplanes deccanensis]GID80467.1 TetR family transcriptional regulator [Actinoplanes deccanensis]